MVRNISTPLLAKKQPEGTVAGERMSTAANLHDALVSRLKSGVVRREADSHRRFLESYRRVDGSTPASDSKLNGIIALMSYRADELEESTGKLRTEDAQLHYRREQLHPKKIRRMPDEDLVNMTAMEKQVVRVTEDKQEEELKRTKDDARAAYLRTHHRLATELSEMRDYRVYLRECRQLRLNKLHEALSIAGDGKIRAIVREMIRHGAQNVLQRLEQQVKWLEPWMREVLVNSCHIGNRIEDAEGRLGGLRSQELQPFQSGLRSLSESTKQERLAALTSPRSSARIPDKPAAPPVPPPPKPAEPDVAPHLRRRNGVRSERAVLQPYVLPILDESQEWPAPIAQATGSCEAEPGGGKKDARSRVPGDVAGKIEAAVKEMDSLRRLLLDMRHNAAAAVCHQIREADRGAGGCCQGAHNWGLSALTVLVSEEFARDTMKAMQKSSTGPKRLTA